MARRIRRALASAVAGCRERRRRWAAGHLRHPAELSRSPTTARSRSSRRRADRSELQVVAKLGSEKSSPCSVSVINSRRATRSGSTRSAFVHLFARRPANVSKHESLKSKEDTMTTLPAAPSFRAAPHSQRPRRFPGPALLDWAKLGRKPRRGSPRRARRSTLIAGAASSRRKIKLS